MDKLLFAVPGLPLGDGRRKFNYASGIEYVAGLGLDAMELMFVRSVTVTDRNCMAIRRASAENDIYLSAHGSYYVNLNSADPEVVSKSLERLRLGAEGLLKVGGRRLVFHAGFYQSSSREEAFRNILANLLRLPDLGVEYRIETTGKPSQFGTVEEICALCLETPFCAPCIDFSHIHARGIGCLKGYADFARILEYVGGKLGEGALKELHAHMAGIRYGAKGEICHVPLKEGDFPYADCLKALYDFDARGVVVAEGPLVEGDSLLLKETYAGLGHSGRFA